MEPAAGESSFERMSFTDLMEAVLTQTRFPARPVAMRVLAERAKCDPAKLSQLMGSLVDVEPSTRRRAAQILGLCGALARSVLPELCRSLQADPMWPVREAAVHALRCICWPHADAEEAKILTVLLDCAQTDKEPLVREAAVQGLAAALQSATNPDESLIWDRLTAEMAHPHASRRCRAVTALCKLAEWNPAVLPAIAQGLRDSHWKVRRVSVQQLADYAASLLSQSGGSVLVAELIKRKFDQHAIVQNAAQEALQSIHASCSETKLKKLLESFLKETSPFALMAFVLTQFDLPAEAETEYLNICQRRLMWHVETSLKVSRPTIEEVASLSQAVLELQAVANQRNTQFAAKETIWLLARWVECYLGTNVNL